tara:strand:+ start:195 stop:431 length:237 start_codon:yes stop_codon:yes gene_type:complete
LATASVDRSGALGYGHTFCQVKQVNVIPRVSKWRQTRGKQTFTAAGVGLACEAGIASAMTVTVALLLTACGQPLWLLQ